MVAAGEQVVPRTVACAPTQSMKESDRHIYVSHSNTYIRMAHRAAACRGACARAPAAVRWDAPHNTYIHIYMCCALPFGHRFGVLGPVLPCALLYVLVLLVLYCTDCHALL